MNIKFRNLDEGLKTILRRIDSPYIISKSHPEWVFDKRGNIRQRSRTLGDKRYAIWDDYVALKIADRDMDIRHYLHHISKPYNGSLLDPSRNYRIIPLSQQNELVKGEWDGELLGKSAILDFINSKDYYRRLKKAKSMYPPLNIGGNIKPLKATLLNELPVVYSGVPDESGYSTCYPFKRKGMDFLSHKTRPLTGVNYAKEGDTNTVPFDMIHESTHPTSLDLSRFARQYNHDLFLGFNGSGSGPTKIKKYTLEFKDMLQLYPEYAAYFDSDDELRSNFMPIIIKARHNGWSPKQAFRLMPQEYGEWDGLMRYYTPEYILNVMTYMLKNGGNINMAPPKGVQKLLDKWRKEENLKLQKEKKEKPVLIRGTVRFDKDGKPIYKYESSKS